MTKNIHQKIQELREICESELADNVSTVYIIIKPNEYDITIQQIPFERKDELNLKGEQPRSFPDVPYISFEINNELNEE